MENISTNKAQSVELMKAGLNIITADCYLTESEYGSSLEHKYDASIILDWMNRKRLFQSGYQNIAAWSLTRLLQLMPPVIDGHQLQLMANSTGWQLCYVCEGKTDGNRYLYRYFGEELMGVAVQLMKKLIADGRLNERYIYHRDDEQSRSQRPTIGDMAMRRFD